MGKIGTSTYIQTLKDYAYGVAQDVQSSLADFIAPRCTVGVGIGKFKKYSDKNAFQVYNTDRAVGGKANRMEFLATDGDFHCNPNALEIPIDDAERTYAGDAADQIEEAKVRALVVNACIGREKKVFDLVKANVAAEAGKGVWSAGANDPIAELDAALEAIAVETGLLPNRMVIGIGAWRILKNHPEVVKRHMHVSNKGVSLDVLAGLLLNPNIDIRIGTLSADANKMGKTASKSNIVGSEIFMFHGNENPTQYDPSFAKTFSIGPNSVESVRAYRDEQSRSDVYAVDWSEDVQVVSAICAKRITVS